ncbi:MAG: glycosyltransferase family 39 protein, partial [Planctomycetota bacterium]
STAQVEPKTTSGPTSRRERWTDRLLIAGATLLAFLFLGNPELTSQSDRMVRGLVKGHIWSVEYPLDTVLIAWLSGVTGSSHFWTALWLGAVCTAVGIGLIHSAARRLTDDRTQANLATGLVSATPVVFLCGTLASGYGLALLMVAVAFWTAAHYVERPTILLAITTGTATAAATWGHVTLTLLPLAVVPLIYFERRSEKRIVLHLTILLTVHVILMSLSDLPFFLADVVPAPRWLCLADLATIGHATAHELLASVHKEWFRPFMPASVLALFAFFNGKVRTRALVFFLCLIPFLALANARAPEDIRTGFVLIPLVWPLSLLVLRCFGNRTCAWTIIVGLLVSLLAIGPSTRDQSARDYARGLESHFSSDQVAMLSFCTRFDAEVLFIHAPRVEFVDLEEVFGEAQFDVPRLAQLFDAKVASILAGGKRLILGQQTEAQLLTHQVALAEFMLHLRQRYELKPVVHGSFRATEVTLAN